jgi:hypothetical protein
LKKLWIFDGRALAVRQRACKAREPDAEVPEESSAVHNRLVPTLVAILALTLLVQGYLASANERDETVLTVVVSSAEHETQEGYFTLGDAATVIAKPGSELYKFLARHRGKKIRISLTEAGRPGLSTLER